MIVIVCQEDTAASASDTLYPSAVTIDGNSLGNSITSAQAANVRSDGCSALRNHAGAAVGTAVTERIKPIRWSSRNRE